MIGAYAYLISRSVRNRLGRQLARLPRWPGRLRRHGVRTQRRRRHGDERDIRPARFGLAGRPPREHTPPQQPTTAQPQGQRNQPQLATHTRSFR